MTTYISLLRAVNVTGHNKVSMNDLKKIYNSLGLDNVRTYVQSGNVVFDSDIKDASGIAPLIESRLLKFFGSSVPVLIRDKHELGKIIDSNPFTKQKKKDPGRFYVTFLPASPADKNKLPPSPLGVDEYIILNKEIYLFCPDGYGKTKLNNNFFEKKLNLPATTRNWNTVNALYNIASSI
jgi:uncharacterized protein (DUF1697 family)